MMDLAAMCQALTVLSCSNAAAMMIVDDQHIDSFDDLPFLMLRCSTIMSNDQVDMQPQGAAPTLAK